jgi:hypothetical protein
VIPAADWQGCGFAVTGPMADLAFDADGTLFYAWSAVQQTTYQQRIYLATSTDLGLTWDVSPLPRIGPDPARRIYGADTMPSLVVDRDNPNRVYVAWWSNNGIWNQPGLITNSESSTWCRLTDNRALARPWVATSTDKVAFVAWDDTRNGNTTTASQDIYFTRVRYAPPAEAFGAGAGKGVSPWLAALMGAAVTLTIGGLVLVGFTQELRTNLEPAPEAGSPAPRKEPQVT